MIKKRTIIASVITVITVVFTYNFWLPFEPISVDFDINGSGNIKIEAVFNKKNNSDFKKIKNETDNFVLSTNTHACLKVKNAKHPRRFMLKFSDYETKQPFSVSNIRIDKDKLKLDKTDKFRAENCEILIKGNDITIIPNDFNCSLIYDEPLNIFCNIDFSLELLIIILIISFLAGYKITDYIADFKTVKNKSRTDIIFLTIFFAFMLLPLSHINQSEISDKEKRKLTEYKPLITQDGKINLNFGSNFNEWFNDRFALRTEFINSYFLFKSIFPGQYSETFQLIYNKKDDFTFHKAYNSPGVFLKNNLFTQEECDKIKSNIIKLNDYCQKHNIKLYIMLSNDKESIYPEFYPNYYKPENNESRLEQLKKLLAEIETLNVVSPYEDIMKAKKEGLIFRKYDTHLNDYGAYIEYYDLVSAINRDFPNVKPLEKEDFNVSLYKDLSGDCMGQSILAKKKFEEYEKYEPKTVNARQVVKRKDSDNNAISVYENDKSGNSVKTVIIGDSFHTKYLTYLSENFKTLKSAFFGGGRYFVLDEKTKKEFFNEKPDILILESTERFLYRFSSTGFISDILERKENE